MFGDRVDAVAAEGVSDAAPCRQQTREGRVAEIEATRVSPEGRHDATRAVGHEAAAADRTAGAHDDRHRMEMARDLTRDGARRRFVTKCQGAELPFARRRAAETIRGRRVVVAGEPNPIAPSLETGQRVAVGVVKAVTPAAYLCEFI